MIECKKCKKQYIGETKRTLRECFCEHRQATNNPLHANAAAAVPSHFNLPGHSITDMGLIPLDGTTTYAQCIAPESTRSLLYLLHGSQTMSPDGINRRNER